MAPPGTWTAMQSTQGTGICTKTAPLRTANLTCCQQKPSAQRLCRHPSNQPPNPPQLLNPAPSPPSTLQVPGLENTPRPGPKAPNPKPCPKITNDSQTALNPIPEPQCPQPPKQSSNTAPKLYHIISACRLPLNPGCLLSTSAGQP